MPKKRLSQLIKEYGTERCVLEEIIETLMSPEMTSGGRGFTWISEEGQAVIEKALKPIPKRTATAIAKDHGASVEHINTLINRHLDENVVTQEDGEYLVSSAGESALAELLAAPQIYTGKVLKDCENKRFVLVSHKEKMQRVPVRIPKKYHKRLVGKMIRFVESEERGEKKYEYFRG